MATYNVQPETNSIIKEYAEQIGVTAEEALDKLIQTANSRRQALAKYAKKNPPKAKAPKAKKAAKAKGPLARKAKAPAKKAKAPKAVAIKVVTGDEPQHTQSAI